jgi:aspartate carbamoyltransferase catalytic subunit
MARWRSRRAGPIAGLSDVTDGGAEARIDPFDWSLMPREKKMAATETVEAIDLSAVTQPIDGDASGKNLLSMHQLSADDIAIYLDEAYAAERAIRDPARRGVPLLPRAVMKAIMRQPSTRTGGSCTSAMRKLGGSAELISGMSSSSEAKGESLADSWVAFATQADLLGIRTAENGGPAFAAHVIAKAVEYGQLAQVVPVINLGDGHNEHPTQALGDLFTVHKKFEHFDGLVITVVGDQERYRAHHSLMIGAATLGMRIVAVESPAARVPQALVELLADRLTRTGDLDAAMRETDVLYIGRNPDEYTGEDPAEIVRAEQLARDYASWIVDYDRIQQMAPESIVLHPRPRRDELDPSVDSDPRMKDVEQMANMIPMRMAIIARHLGASIARGA